jgi:hypothetical protein
MRKARVVIVEMNLNYPKSFLFEFASMESLIAQIELTIDAKEEKWGILPSYNFEITIEEQGQFTSEELDILEDEGYMISYQ